MLYIILRLRCERGRPPQYQTVLSNITVTILPLLQKKRLPGESPFALCGTELQVNAPFRALVEAVERVDKTNRAALIAHDDGVGAGAAAEILDAAHHRRVRNSRRRENAVVAFDQVVNR